MLDFSEELARLKICTCSSRPLDLCPHEEHCIRREPGDLLAWCPSCVLDLAHALADLDVMPVDSIALDDRPRLRAAIRLALCPVCQTTAFAQLEEIATDARHVATSTAAGSK